MDVLMSCILILALANAVDAHWFKSTRLVWMGKFSLGAYILHPFLSVYPLDKYDAQGLYFFSVDNNVIIPSLVDSAKALGNWGYCIPLALLIVAYSVVFMMTLAPLFQYLCVGTFAVCTKPITSLYDKLHQ
eukprot:gnl/TRDRNA2_/TRDRNA2_170952_c1_seq1.p2 gnl/TRDRNA2_/TRDRNA2_170952_c1~~gnl/TRDRNA2_/TRDRNA2_170952_c1_seq1.p2  ORF type:complete len:131 (+),score=19.23 gnl/TRDRNA2_/TRDRNA2_170952_c1_seq1:3-395(+)